MRVNEKILALPFANKTASTPHMFPQKVSELSASLLRTPTEPSAATSAGHTAPRSGSASPVQSFLPIFGFGPRKRPKKVYLTSSPNCHQFQSSNHASFTVARQCQLIRKLDRGEQTCLLSPPHCHLGGRAFGPPLCRGCAPATPPYKTIAHPPCLRIPAVPLQQRGRRQPNRQSDSLNGGSDMEPVKTGAVFDSVVTPPPEMGPSLC